MGRIFYMSIQTDICNLLGIPRNSTEEEITDAYAEILQNELSGKAVVPQYNEIYQTYQEWITWKKQSQALSRVLQKESLKQRTVSRDEFENFYAAYQEWNKLKEQDLSLESGALKSPSIVIQLSAIQAWLALIPISAVAIGIVWGGTILVTQNRQVPIVITEEPINRPVPIAPNDQTAAPSTTARSTPQPAQTKSAEPIKRTPSPKPSPTVAKQKSATPTIPLSNVTFSKTPALSVPLKVSAAPAPTQTSPNLVESDENSVGVKLESPEASGKSMENTLQTLQTIPIELENGATIPASQLLKLNLNEDGQKARQLSRFLKELASSQDVAQARLISEIAIPQLQELAKEAKSLP
jgi:hypothetical protein